MLPPILRTMGLQRGHQIYSGKGKKQLTWFKLKNMIKHALKDTLVNNYEDADNGFHRLNSIDVRIEKLSTDIRNVGYK